MKIAEKTEAVIINADSIQAYKDLRTISARPTLQDEAKIIHKLYGFLNHDQQLNVAKWFDLAVKEIKSCYLKNKTPIIVGGTGMYINSLLNGISNIPTIDSKVKQKVANMTMQEQYKAMPLNCREVIKSGDSQRIIRALEVFFQTGKSMYDFKNIMFHNNYVNLVNIPNDRQMLKDNIKLRVEQMFANNAIEEVELLLKKHPDPNASIFKTIGVREINSYLANNINIEECKEQVTIKTRQYAKRQLTWARNKYKIALNVYNLNLNNIMQLWK